MARIVVVDDDLMARRFTVGCLETQGYEIQELEPTCLFSVLSQPSMRHPLICWLPTSSCRTAQVRP